MPRSFFLPGCDHLLHEPVQEVGGARVPIVGVDGCRRVGAVDERAPELIAARQHVQHPQPAVGVDVRDRVRVPHVELVQEIATVGEFRATRRDRKPPSDADIERGLRERAVNDPRAAKILLRWLQRPRPVTETPEVDLDSMSEAQLERLYAGLTRLAELPPNELQALVASLLADEADA
jgi:hypothetical protein